MKYKSININKSENIEKNKNVKYDKIAKNEYKKKKGNFYIISKITFLSFIFFILLICLILMSYNKCIIKTWDIEMNISKDGKYTTEEKVVYSAIEDETFERFEKSFMNIHGTEVYSLENGERKLINNKEDFSYDENFFVMLKNDLKNSLSFNKKYKTKVYEIKQKGNIKEVLKDKDNKNRFIINIAHNFYNDTNILYFSKIKFENINLNAKIKNEDDSKIVKSEKLVPLFDSLNFFKINNPNNILDGLNLYYEVLNASEIKDETKEGYKARSRNLSNYEEEKEKIQKKYKRYNKYFNTFNFIDNNVLIISFIIISSGIILINIRYKKANLDEEKELQKEIDDLKKAKSDPKYTKEIFDILNKDFKMDIAKIAYINGTQVKNVFISSLIKLMHLDILKIREDENVNLKKKSLIEKLKNEKDLIYELDIEKYKEEKEKENIQEIDEYTFYTILDATKNNEKTKTKYENKNKNEKIEIDSKYLNEYIEKKFNQIYTYKYIKKIINSNFNVFKNEGLIRTRKNINLRILSLVGILLYIMFYFNAFINETFFILLILNTYQKIKELRYAKGNPENRYTKKGMYLKNKILAFKKYIKDYGIMDTFDEKYVYLYDEYLIYASIFENAENAFKDISRRLYSDDEFIRKIEIEENRN